MEAALFFQKTGVVDNAAAFGVVAVGDDGVEHLVIDHIFQEPSGHKSPVEEWVDADHPIVFLDGAKYDGLPRTLAAAAAPKDPVAFNPIAKVTRVHLVEDGAEVEEAPLGFFKVELALQRKERGADFAFRRFDESAGSRGLGFGAANGAFGGGHGAGCDSGNVRTLEATKPGDKN